MWRCTLCILILQYCLAMERNWRRSSPANATRDILINTGVVRGHLITDEERPYYAFLGIPFAAPVTSSSIFKAPLPRAPWSGTLIANRQVDCTQSNEDCLAINVFTPIENTDTTKPVLVHIHGGGFTRQRPAFSGQAHFVWQNIIVVSMSYRLGVYGFLCLGLDEAPGNAGMKDQVAALRWVQENIHNFGGDPTRVTLYGLSSGGACAELHVLSKMSTNLFQRVIVDGGTSLCSYAVNVDPIHTAVGYAKGDIPKQTRELILSLHDSELNMQNLPNSSGFTDGTFGFAPCVERRLHGTKPFILKSPQEILEKQDYNHVPFMFVFSIMEGFFMKDDVYDGYYPEMEASFHKFLPADLMFENDQIKKEVAKKIKSFYFGNKTVGDESNRIPYINYFGDIFTMNGLLTSAEMHARNQNAVYLMEYAFKNIHYIGSEWSVNTTAHVDFTVSMLLNRKKLLPSDRQALERAVKLTANFVKFGNPTPAPTQLLPVAWPQVVPGNVTYLSMGEEFTVHRLEDSTFWDRRVFWNTLYNKYGRRIRPVNPKVKIK